MKNGSKFDPTQNIVIGNRGENLVHSLLDEVAVLTKPAEDGGEDLITYKEPCRRMHKSRRQPQKTPNPPKIHLKYIP